MKKYLIAFCIALTALCICSCATKAPSSGNIGEATEAQIKQIVLGKDGIQRPDWVVKTPKANDVVYAKASGKMSNFTNSHKKATVEAKNVLAEFIGTSVKEIIKNYNVDAGDENSRQALDAMESLSIQLSSAVLIGVEEEEFWEAQDGTVWVLVCLPKENITNGLEDSINKIKEKEFKQNPTAAAALDRMDKAFNSFMQTASPSDES